MNVKKRFSATHFSFSTTYLFRFLESRPVGSRRSCLTQPINWKKIFSQQAIKGPAEQTFVKPLVMSLPVGRKFIWFHIAPKHWLNAYSPSMWWPWSWWWGLGNRATRISNDLYSSDIMNAFKLVKGLAQPQLHGPNLGQSIMIANRINMNHWTFQSSTRCFAHTHSSQRVRKNRYLWKYMFANRIRKGERGYGIDRLRV